MRRELVVGVAALALALALAAACGGNGGSRQDEVAERGRSVMPFDLEATTHHFESTGTGLVQTVVADDPDDEEQVRLIREHLAEEAARFERGDYDDPAAIHGEDMPGLAELTAGADAVTITLSDRNDGAQIDFATDDPDLVAALHAWAEAQIADHGRHARP